MPVICSPSGVLLRRRPDTGLLAGLWEFPAADGWLEPEEVKGLARELGGQAISCRKLEDQPAHLHPTWSGTCGATPFTPGISRRRRDMSGRPPGSWNRITPLPSAYKTYLQDALRLLRQQAAGLEGE